jgi:hypothetical protein
MRIRAKSAWFRITFGDLETMMVVAAGGIAGPHMRLARTPTNGLAGDML